MTAAVSSFFFSSPPEIFRVGLALYSLVGLSGGPIMREFTHYSANYPQAGRQTLEGSQDTSEIESNHKTKDEDCLDFTTLTSFWQSMHKLRAAVQCGLPISERGRNNFVSRGTYSLQNHLAIPFFILQRIDIHRDEEPHKPGF